MKQKKSIYTIIGHTEVAYTFKYYYFYYVLLTFLPSHLPVFPSSDDTHVQGIGVRLIGSDFKYVLIFPFLIHHIQDVFSCDNCKQFLESLDLIDKIC